MKFSYFKSVMNCLDLIVIGLTYVCTGFNIYRQVQVNNLLDELIQTKERQFSDFSFLCYCQYQVNLILSVTIFLAWIKVNRSDEQKSNRIRFSSLEFYADIQICQFQQNDDATE